MSSITTIVGREEIVSSSPANGTARLVDGRELCFAVSLRVLIDD